MMRAWTVPQKKSTSDRNTHSQRKQTLTVADQFAFPHTDLRLKHIVLSLAEWEKAKDLYRSLIHMHSFAIFFQHLLRLVQSATTKETCFCFLCFMVAVAQNMMIGLKIYDVILMCLIQCSNVSVCSRTLTAVLLEVLIQVICSAVNADCWEATKCYPVRHFFPKKKGQTGFTLDGFIGRK